MVWGVQMITNSVNNNFLLDATIFLTSKKYWFQTAMQPRGRAESHPDATSFLIILVEAVPVVQDNVFRPLGVGMLTTERCSG